VNIRGIGLFDSGGNSDLTQGWRVDDIENVVLAQSNGVPVQVKNVAEVSVGYVPRLGIAGKDHDDDVALAIVVMGRTYHANDVIPLIKDKIGFCTWGAGHRSEARLYVIVLHLLKACSNWAGKSAATYVSITGGARPEPTFAATTATRATTATTKSKSCGTTTA
jgi:hypothetical protein